MVFSTFADFRKLQIPNAQTKYFEILTLLRIHLPLAKLQIDTLKLYITFRRCQTNSDYFSTMGYMKTHTHSGTQNCVAYAVICESMATTSQIIASVGTLRLRRQLLTRKLHAYPFWYINQRFSHWVLWLVTLTGFYVKIAVFWWQCINMFLKLLAAFPPANQ